MTIPLVGATLIFCYTFWIFIACDFLPVLVVVVVFGDLYISSKFTPNSAAVANWKAKMDALYFYRWFSHQTIINSFAPEWDRTTWQFIYIQFQLVITFRSKQNKFGERWVSSLSSTIVVHGKAHHRISSCTRNRMKIISREQLQAFTTLNKQCEK